MKPEARICYYFGRYWLLAVDDSAVYGGPFFSRQAALDQIEPLGLRKGAEGVYEPNQPAYGIMYAIMRGTA